MAANPTDSRINPMATPASSQRSSDGVSGVTSRTSAIRADIAHGYTSSSKTRQSRRSGRQGSWQVFCTELCVGRLPAQRGVAQRQHRHAACNCRCRVSRRSGRARRRTRLPSAQQKRPSSAVAIAFRGLSQSAAQTMQNTGQSRATASWGIWKLQNLRTLRPETKTRAVGLRHAREEER
jgi:hypothetical protein